MPFIYRLEVPAVSGAGWLGIFKGTSNPAYRYHILFELPWWKRDKVRKALYALDTFFEEFADLHTLPWDDEIPILENDVACNFFENNPSWIFGFLEEDDYLGWFPPEVLGTTLKTLKVHVAKYAVSNKDLQIGCTQVMFDSKKATLISRSPL